MPDSVLDRLARISSGSLTTQFFKQGLRQPVMVGLKPLQGANARPFAGRVFTLHMIPAREDIDTYATVTTTPHADNLQWVGVEQVRPGDVMVIDSRGDSSAASMGNMLVTRMMLRGARGVVTDGAFRDGQELNVVHYFPPDLLEIPWRGADVIASKWAWCVQNLGAQWTIDRLLISHDSAEAVVEWTHWKRHTQTAQRGDEWYVFCERSGLIKEIRAYCAAPAAAPAAKDLATPPLVQGTHIAERVDFDYAGRGYHLRGK